MKEQNFFKILENPIRARIIEILHDGVHMTYDEMLRYLRIGPWQLDARLRELEGLVKSSSNGTYWLTEKGRIAYQIMKDLPRFNISKDIVVQASKKKRLATTFLDFIFFFSMPSMLVDRIEIAIILIIAVLTAWTLMEAYMGRTPGKYFAGTRVIHENGKKIELKTSFIRNLGKFFYPLDILLGYLKCKNKGYLRYTDFKTKVMVIDEE